MKNFIDFIGIWENSLSPEECGYFVKWYNLCEENKLTISSAQEIGISSAHNRDDHVVHIPQQAGLNNGTFPENLVARYWEAINKCLIEYQTKYPNSNVGQLTSYGWKVHKVMSGEGYHLFHSEKDANRPLRHLAWMTYLHSPTDGGETEFLYQNLRVEPKVGTTLIWPAQWTHTHRGNPPLDGFKMYTTGWFSLVHPTF